jgi:DNA-binding Lrp family transcriptional regulator
MKATLSMGVAFIVSKKMKYKKGSFITIPNIEKLKELDAYSQALFIWMCYHSNQDGFCFPSRKKLAEESGMSLASVKRSIKKLEDKGVIKKTTRKKGKKNMTNLYEIIILRVGSERTQGGSERTQGGSERTQGVGSERAGELNPVSLTKSTEVALTKKTEKFIKELKEVFKDTKLNQKEVEELKKFVSYWTEPNRSKTKLRWELERTWDMKRRVGTWTRNAEKFEGKSNNKYKAKML